LLDSLLQENRLRMVLRHWIALSMSVSATWARLNLSDSTIISDDASINSAVMSGNLRGEYRAGEFGEQKCPKYKLDHDIEVFHSTKGNHEKMARLKDLRKKYPLEEFNPHEHVTECLNDGAGQKLTDAFCKSFAEKGACLGLIREVEKFKENRYLGDDWRPRDITNGSYSQALYMASYCRQACKNKYKDLNIEDLPPQNQWLGGFEDFIVEPFGQRLNICDVSQGWTSYAVYRALETLIMASIQLPLAPALHPVGFEKTKIPRAIYAQILSARKRLLLTEKKYEIESCDIGMHNCARVVVSNVSKECHLVSNENYKFLKIDRKTSDSVFEQLKDLAEKWIGNRIELIGTAVYGLRKYTRGAYLLSHLDHLETHVVSAILNIAQDVDEDWPLQIMDHNGNPHEVILAPGEMIWYESAKLVHARIKPLVGKYFENMFVHYMPRSLKWYSSDSSLTHEPVKIITIEELEASEKQFKEDRKSLRDQQAEDARQKKENYDKLTTEEKLQMLGSRLSYEN